MNLSCFKKFLREAKYFGMSLLVAGQLVILIPFECLRTLFVANGRWKVTLPVGLSGSILAAVIGIKPVMWISLALLILIPLIGLAFIVNAIMHRPDDHKPDAEVEIDN